MTFWAILFLLVLVAALVAYVGDQVAKRVGKRHWRFLGLRPRATATLVAVGTGVLIALGGFGTFFLLVRDARETILQADQVRQERNRLRTEVDRLEYRAAATLIDTEKLKNERNEFERLNQRLADELAQRAEQQQHTREELNKTLAEQQKLSFEVDKLRKASDQQKTDLQKLEQSRQILLKERATLQQQKSQLVTSRAEMALQAQKAEQRLHDLEAASREALTRYTSLQNRTKTLQAKTVDLQQRIASLEGDKTKLEADKRNLEGDVAVLVGSKEASSKGGKDPAATIAAANANLEALQKENSGLRESLNSMQRDLQQMRDRSRLMIGSLDKALGSYLLAEESIQDIANAQGDLAELLRKADGRSRLLGLRGLEVINTPDLTGVSGGLLLARVVGINPDGRARVRVDYRAKERVFATGEVLASIGLSLPAAPYEIRRKLDSLNQATISRLTQAGWIPEKIAQDGITLDALVGLVAQLSGKRGGAKLAVVALENLYPTEEPKLGLQLLP